MIKEVTTFIETKAGLTRDTDLFAGHRPQGTVAACDVVLESSGGSVLFDLPERADIMFQVLSRDETYFTARARAYVIYDAIFGDWGHGSAGWTLSPLVTDDTISACDAAVDWAGTVLSIDAVDFKEGTGSLKDDVAAPVVTTTYSTIYNPVGTWDWSNKRNILFWLKSDRIYSDFATAALRIYEGANWREWSLFFSANTWTPIIKPLLTGDVQSATPPNLALIDDVRIHFHTVLDPVLGIIPFYKKIDNLRVVEEKYEAMVIEPLAPPQYIGQDEKSRYEFSTNYLMKIKKL